MRQHEACCPPASLTSEPEGPPAFVTLTIDEALDLLTVLEEARETFYESDLLGGVIGAEESIRLLSRKLGFDDSGGQDDGL